MMIEMSEKESQLNRLLEELAPRLATPKAELVKEIEAQLTTLLGIEAREAFDAVAAAQHYPAPSLNLDRAHKSALLLIAYVLEKTT
jgi:hypothetical protein